MKVCAREKITTSSLSSKIPRWSRGTFNYFSRPQIVRQGTLMRVCKRKPKPMGLSTFRHIDVWNAALRWAASRPSTIASIPAQYRHSRASDIRRVRNAFQVASPENHSSRLQTSYERDSWVKDMKDCIGNLGHQRARSMTNAHRASMELPSSRAGSSDAPVWIPDELALKCAVCDTGFWLLLRKHHCRVCGKVVCSKCSETRKLIPTIDKKAKVRVCDECEGIDPKGKKLNKGKSSKNLLSKLMSGKKATNADKMWYYLDDEGKERGPYSGHDILNWFNLNYLGPGKKCGWMPKGPRRTAFCKTL